ncbi:MAG: CBO0543 family protein [Bacillota bacterium]|nr:CBO0543 family protein [Bacillota bacterium]
MILNILIGFIIPWIFGIVLFFKDKKILLVISPFTAILAYTLNEFCFHLNFWRLIPIDMNDDLTAVSTNLGLYPILGCYLIYCISKSSLNSYLIVIAFTIITTISEYIAVLFKLVKYGNGWNVGWTFVSYLIPYLLVNWYYDKLKAINVF